MIPTTYPIICGLDVHRGTISAALLDARGQTEPILYTHEFSALTYGLYDLRQWLLDHDCPLVAEAQEPDPLTMANLAKGKLRKKIAQLSEALKGHLSVEHRFILEFLLNDLKHIEDDLLLLDTRINAYISEHKLQPWLDLLLSVPGIKRLSAINILAEIGTDLSSFPDSAHFASWIALCPGNNISAGKAKSSKIRKANRYLRSALVQVAWAAARQKNSPLAKYFYTIKRRRGTNKALIALAHKLVRIIYALFTRQEKFDWAKLISTPVSTQTAPMMTEVPDEELPAVSELSENLAHIVAMAEEDELPETTTEETSLSSPALPTIPDDQVQAVITDNSKVSEINMALPEKRRSTKTEYKKERPTTTEPVARRRGRPRKQQTEG